MAEFATGDATVATAESAPVSENVAEEENVDDESAEELESEVSGDCFASPAARKMIEENSLDACAITATGKGGRVTKEDAQNAEARKERYKNNHVIWC